MTNPVRQRLSIDAYVVAFSEKHHYQIKEEDQPHIEDIRGVYLLNRNERTFCCELTPSYWLIHLYDEVILTEDAEETLDDYERDRLFQEYEHCGGGDIYVHCHTIDALLAANKPFTVHHHGRTGVRYSQANYDEQIEWLAEHFCGNHVL